MAGPQTTAVLEADECQVLACDSEVSVGLFGTIVEHRVHAQLKLGTCPYE